MISKKAQAKFLVETMLSITECGKEDIRRGIQNRFIADGRVNYSILTELFLNESIGAMFIDGDWFFAKSVTFFEVGV